MILQSRLDETKPSPICPWTFSSYFQISMETMIFTHLIRRSSRISVMQCLPTTTRMCTIIMTYMLQMLLKWHLCSFRRELSMISLSSPTLKGHPWSWLPCATISIMMDTIISSTWMQRLKELSDITTKLCRKIGMLPKPYSLWLFQRTTSWMDSTSMRALFSMRE